MNSGLPVRRREVAAWAMFDFANSSFTTMIVTVAFSVVFTKLIAPGGDWLWGLALLVSNLLVVLTAPILGAIGDAAGRKKQLLLIVTLLCVTATAALGLAGPGDIALALVLFILGNLGYALGEGFAGAFLPEISTPTTVGRVSGFGWALGYLGGLGCLLWARPLLAAGFTLDNFDALRRIGPMTAVWFALSAVPTFLFLRERVERSPIGNPMAQLGVGIARLKDTLRRVSHFRDLSTFLTVFGIYSAGLASVIAFAAVFAERELGFTGGELISLFLVLQLSSAAGAAVFGVLQDRFGSGRTLRTTLWLWVLVSVATALCRTKAEFWALALIAGIGIGSLQAASRALVGLFSPPEKSGEFFGLWSLSYRVAAALGPALFGVLSSTVGGRIAVTVNGGLFLLGIAGLSRVDERRGRAAAESWNPETAS